MIIRDKVFNTLPLVFHCPVSNDFWEKVIKSFFAEPQQQIQVDNLTIVTWNTSETIGILEKSLEHLGLQCVVLGKGISNWSNLNKITTLCEYLPFISTDYVMGVDCYDAILIGHPQIIINKFLKMGLKLCYNSSSKDYGLCSSSKLENKLYQGMLPHLNGGVFIGHTEFVRKFFDIALEMIPIFGHLLRHLKDEEIVWENASIKQKDLGGIKTSEQAILKIVSTMFYPYVGIDHKCEIFDLIQADCDRLKIINSKLFY